MHGLAVSCRLVKLKAAVNTALSQAEESPAKAFDCLVTFRDEVNNSVATLLEHLLHMAGGYFSDVSSRRRKQITKDIRDPQLSRWLNDSIKTLTALFPKDISSAKETARARHMDGLLSLASQAVSAVPASRSSSSRASAATGCGQHQEPYPQPLRWPFHGGCSQGYGSWGGEGVNIPTTTIARTLLPATPFPDPLIGESLPSPPKACLAPPPPVWLLSLINGSLLMLPILS